MSSATLGKHTGRQIIITAVICLLPGIFFVSQAESFEGTLEIILDAPLSIILIGIALYFITCVAAAASYVALAHSKLVRLRPTFILQLASGVTSRLLPAGLGGMGIYLIYLKRNKFETPDATGIVAANNILGTVGNLILLAASLLVSLFLASQARPPLVFPKIPVGYVIAVLVAALIIAIVLALRGKWFRKIKAFVGSAWQSLRVTLRPNRHTAMSLGSNMVLTLCNTIILCLAVVASGETMFWPLSIAVLSIGALLGAAVPTPGGLGAVEAGLVAGLVACGVPAAPALAAALIYRGITYWFPILPGLIALPWVRKHYLY